jgi:hypothetical protein
MPQTAFPRPYRTDRIDLIEHLTHHPAPYKTGLVPIS